MNFDRRIERLRQLVDKTTDIKKKEHDLKDYLRQTNMIAYQMFDDFLHEVYRETYLDKMAVHELIDEYKECTKTRGFVINEDIRVMWSQGKLWFNGKEMT